MWRTVVALLFSITLTTHADPPRYRTPFKGPVVGNGQSVDRSGSSRHEQVGRFSWGTTTTSDRSRGYQHQTDGSYYRDRENRTSEGYYRSPFGSGGSRTVDNSGSDRYYDHDGEPSRILSMYKAEHQYRVQRLLERYDNLKVIEAKISSSISRGRSLLNQPDLQAKITPAELSGLRAVYDRSERELAEYKAERRALANEIDSLRR